MTEKQRRFADEYLIDRNATRAYKAAYPAVKKDETAKAAASRLLTFVNVKEYIEKREKELQEHAKITQEKVIDELAAIAFADVCDIVSIEGDAVRILNTDELKPAQRKTIAAIKQGEFGIEVKFHDKMKAMEMLCKLLGFGKDKLDRKEQKARIAKLRADTKTESAEDKTVTVRFVDFDELEEQG